MKYIVAVSGGVDSVTLLDVMAKKHSSKDILVAHFEHGIRGIESQADARFVVELAKKYGLACEIGYGTLGDSASEAEAREKRYEFLHRIAAQTGATIVTAHHQDDLLETIALNIQRGTGWRGLTPFSDTRIVRPFLTKTKAELYEYALQHSLEWVEDATNMSDVYTRNRVRRKMHQVSSTDVKKLVQLYTEQQKLRKTIEAEDKKLLPLTSSRYFLTMIDANVAVELLREKTNARLTRPQLERLLLAIKTALPHTKQELGSGIEAQFTPREVVVEQ